MQKKENLFAKEYRKRYWKYLKKSIFKTTSIAWILSFFLFFYTISFYLVILKYTLFTFLVLMLIFLFYFLTKHRVHKSIQLNNALGQASFSLCTVNLFIYIPKMFDINIFQFHFLTTLVFGFVFIQSIFGIKFFIEEYQKVNTIYKQLTLQ